jgi:hypothetical protein
VRGKTIVSNASQRTVALRAKPTKKNKARTSQILSPTRGAMRAACRFLVPLAESAGSDRASAFDFGLRLQFASHRR